LVKTNIGTGFPSIVGIIISAEIVGIAS
jgi:hypothetical protein